MVPVLSNLLRLLEAIAVATSAIRVMNPTTRTAPAIRTSRSVAPDSLFRRLRLGCVRFIRFALVAPVGTGPVPGPDSSRGRDGYRYPSRVGAAGGEVVRQASVGAGSSGRRVLAGQSFGVEGGIRIGAVRGISQQGAVKRGRRTRA